MTTTLPHTVSTPRPVRRRNLKGMQTLKMGLLMAGLLTGVAACVPAHTGPAEGIGFREARFQEISAMREYRSCVEDATAQGDTARQTANAGAYLASARLLEQCEANLGPEAQQIAVEERMQAYALSILNYVRAGDLASAQQNLETFRMAFPGQDLSLQDGSSFLDNMAFLTRGIVQPTGGEQPLFNVNRNLRAEMSRARYWKQN